MKLEGGKIEIMRKKGVSLVALIVTIIVIIILAMIVMLSSGDTIQSAIVAKFKSEVGDMQQAVQHDFAARKMDDSVNASLRSNEEIYYMIATGKTIESQKDIWPKGLIPDSITENISVYCAWLPR